MSEQVKERMLNAMMDPKKVSKNIYIRKKTWDGLSAYCKARGIKPSFVISFLVMDFLEGLEREGDGKK